MQANGGVEPEDSYHLSAARKRLGDDPEARYHRGWSARDSGVSCGLAARLGRCQMLLTWMGSEQVCSAACALFLCCTTGVDQVDGATSAWKRVADLREGFAAALQGSIPAIVLCDAWH
eukprot:2549431-Rhodomonas_salina.3